MQIKKRQWSSFSHKRLSCLDDVQWT